MPRVGFEPTIPAFKRAKTVHALDHAATAIGVKAWNISLFPEPPKCVKIACVKRELFLYFPFIFWATQVLKLLLVESKVDYLFSNEVNLGPFH
jgi:hypothetical protein